MHPSRLLPVLLLALTTPFLRADMSVATFKMRPPPAPAQPAATARARLEAVQHALTQAQTALAGVKSPDSGGHLARTRTAVVQALTHSAAALAHLRSNPKEDLLSGGPAPAETLLVRPLALSGLPEAPNLGLLAALEGLNTALNQLLNNPDPAYRGPVLGSLGGYREKIMSDIGAASAALFVGIKADLAATQAKRVTDRLAADLAREAVRANLVGKAVAHLKAHPTKPDATWTAAQAGVEEEPDHYEVGFTSNQSGMPAVGEPIVFIDKKTLEVTKVVLRQ
jgi:hypothetical protein